MPSFSCIRFISRRNTMIGEEDNPNVPCLLIKNNYQVTGYYSFIYQTMNYIIIKSTFHHELETSRRYCPWW